LATGIAAAQNKRKHPFGQLLENTNVAQSEHLELPFRLAAFELVILDDFPPATPDFTVFRTKIFEFTNFSTWVTFSQR
jgi:hypothetical protein